MRRSLLRLSLFLYLFSMVLPMDMVEGSAYFGDYIPGLAALVGGFFSIGMIGENPFLFFAWMSNFLLIAGYIRGLGFRTSSRPLAVAVLILSSPMLFSLEFLDPLSAMGSPAFLVWYFSMAMFMVAEFTPGEKTLERMSSYLKVNGRPRLLHTESDLLALVPDPASGEHVEVHLMGKDDSGVKAHFNSHYAYATFLRHKGDPGLMTQGNLAETPEMQVFQSRKFGFRRFPGLYLITHEQAVNILRYFAKTGEPEPSIKWTSDEDNATEIQISEPDLHLEL